MGDIKSIMNMAETEADTPKKDEDDSKDTNTRSRSLRSMANHTEKKRTADISESSSTMSIQEKKLLGMCKPISVKLIRLPDAVAYKFWQAAEERSKKRKKYKWKVGFHNSVARKRLQTHKKLRQETTTLLKWLQCEKNEIDEKDVENPKHKEIDGEKIAEKSESPTIEESSRRKTDLSKQSIAIEENDIHESGECTENTETSTQVPTRSELAENESQIVEKSCEISLNNTDLRNYPKMSDTIEIRLATSIPQNLSTTVVNATELSSKSSPVAKIRKRILQSDVGNNCVRKHRSKKFKAARSSDPVEEINAMHEKNESDSSQSIIPPTVKNFTANRLNRAKPKSVRRRSIETEKNKLREIKVVLRRIEDSQEPLVLKWTTENALVNKNEIISIKSKTSPTKSRQPIEESSKIGTVDTVAPIKSPENVSINLDILRRLNGTEKADKDVLLSKKNISTAPETATAVPIVSEEIRENQTELDDDEIVHFLRRRRKIRPSIDSSSSASSANSETLLSTRLLRSKTPAINESLIEKTVEPPVTRKTPRLRIRERSTSTDTSSNEIINNDGEISAPLCQESTNTLSSREPETTDSTINRTTGSSEPHQEPQRPPSSCIKASPVAKDDKIVNNGDFHSEEETTVSASIKDSANVCNSPNVEENKTEIIDTSDTSFVGKSWNFDGCRQNQEDEVNCNYSEIDNTNSDNSNEVLIARRKLNTLKNAMVVLTRLEDLDGNEIEFDTGDEFNFSISPTPDSLAIERNDNEHSLDETENSIVPFTSASTTSPRRTLRSDIAVMTNSTENIQESPESDVELHLSLDDVQSQENIESDVEMTLVFEEGSTHESENSDAELPMSEDADRTKLAHRNGDESSNLVSLDGEKVVETQNGEATNMLKTSSTNSAENLPEGILTDARSNSGDLRKVPDDCEDLDEHCKHCSCEEHKSDKRRLKCQNIAGLYKCVTCRIIFKDAASLEAHKNSVTACISSLVCNICEITFSTHTELTIHHLSCVKKLSEKQSSVDDSTNAEVNAEAENPNVENTKKSSIKANQKSENTPKPLSKRMRAKNRATIDDLQCGVCSITFGTSQALSEHIFKHNAKELQQAYKNAKAKALGDSTKSKTVCDKQKDKATSFKESTPSIVSVEALEDNSLPQQSIADIRPSNEITVANRDTNIKPETVCPCHRDIHPACPDKSDLQIEMVLFCQYCQTIFRRRECCEVHYRKSPQCCVDRIRGRSSKLYCVNCQSTLNSWAGMRRHLEVHASLNVDGTVRFVCNICRVIFVGFGALFYNHWSNHVKDTMFVASRHSFPKNSVQPIDDIPKLPIGAKSGESYILVAEHVCSNCKKPFSTRRDMEMHEKNKTCNNTEGDVANGKQWYCDVCNLHFISRKCFNMHCQSHHGRRFLYVASSPLTPAFMCTRCFAMRKLVADIEDHWKTASHHDAPLTFVENEEITEKNCIAVEESGANDTRNVNDIATKSVLDTSVDKTKVINSEKESKNKSAESLNDISKTTEPEITCVFQPPTTKILGNQVASVNNQESQVELTESSGSSVEKTDNSSMLRNLLEPSSASDKNESTKTRALEDPCVNIVLSDLSSDNVSAKLVINDNRTKCSDVSNNQSKIDSSKIVMTSVASSNNAEVKKLATQSTISNNEANKESSTIDTSDTPIVAASAPVLSVNKDSHSKDSLNLDVSARTADAAGEERNKKSFESTESQRSGSQVAAWLKQVLSDIPLTKLKAQLAPSASTEPEIIDLSDENDDDIALQTAISEKTSKPTSVITKHGKSVSASKKSASVKSKKTSSQTKTPSKTRCVKDCGVVNSNVYPFVLDTAEKSFEEIRFADYTRTKELALKNAAVAKKPGFLRVKNLSELQAIKIHNCLNCNTVFETSTALEDHYRSRSCASLKKPAECPKEMTGAPILPNNSNSTSAQSVPSVYATGNVVTQQLIGIDPGLGVISGVPVPSVIVNNENAGSWLTVGAQHNSIPPVALVNPPHSLSGGTLFMNFGNPQTINNNTNGIIATSITTSTANITQTQEILAVQQQQRQYQQQHQQQPYQQHQQQQQQHQQPHQQQQQPYQQQQQQQQLYQQQQQQQQPYQQQQQQQQPYQQQQHQQPYQQPILGINQQLGNKCNGQLGFHVMPAMVLPQNSQINKQQYTDMGLRNTSIANLPINGHINGVPYTNHSSKPNRYICSICTTYSCNSIGTMNIHVMKHYTGFNNPTSQNSSRTATGISPNGGLQVSKDKSSPNVSMRSKAREANLIGSPMTDSVFLKNTPQGLVWVTSVSTPMTTNQQPGSSAGTDNGPFNHDPNSVRGGQIVYRCLICKDAMYKTYPPLRDHVISAHGISDLVAAGIENIVQKMYLCTYCPHGATMYDSEQSLRQHVDTFHSFVCLNCGRIFPTHNRLKMHMTSCSVANRDTNNATDKNC